VSYGPVVLGRRGLGVVDISTEAAGDEIFGNFGGVIGDARDQPTSP
jgi:hypothetical protein